MCGRFSLSAPSEELARTLGSPQLAGFRIEARFNIAPGQHIIVLRPEKGERTPSWARWGLVPAWARDPDAGPKPINARAEGLATKPTFRSAFQRGRCIIPASGFYEWKGVGKSRQPHYIHPKGGGASSCLQAWWTVVRSQGRPDNLHCHHHHPQRTDGQTSPQRLEVSVWGWGVGLEMWLIEHQVIHGNLLQEDTWDRAEDVLAAAREREDGTPMAVRAACADLGGHFSKQVFQFSRRPSLRGLIHPSRGATRPQRKLTVRDKKGRAYYIDTVGAKDHVYAAVAAPEAGPGSMHLPNDTDQMYVEQLLSERPSTEHRRRAYKTKTADARNEALDCAVMALAAVEIFNPKDISALVASPAPRVRKGSFRPTESAAPGAPEVVREPTPQQPARRPKRRLGSWGTGSGGGAW